MHVYVCVCVCVRESVCMCVVCVCVCERGVWVWPSHVFMYIMCVYISIHICAHSPYVCVHFK